MSRNLFGNDADQEIVGRVNALAQEKGVTASQVALAWVLRQPGVTGAIIVNSSRAVLYASNGPDFASAARQAAMATRAALNDAR